MKVMQTRKTRNLVLAAAIISVYSFCLVATAWATVSFVKPQDAAQRVEVAKKSDIPTNIDQKLKTRAPEPSTIALFGSGFLGMLMSFVRRTYAITKRVFDVFMCAIIMIVAFPIFALIALAVKFTSRGPVIYSQVRVGKDGENFRMYKFRTMKINAEKETGPVWAAANDNRLTPIGGFLRKTHLDEIPQAYNVLRGEMSIIGPRPERPKFVNEFKESIPDYMMRLAIKPGITGLAQVWHRYDETIADVKKKLKYDILYVKRMCLWADVQILLRTVRVVFTGEGAR